MVSLRGLLKPYNHITNLGYTSGIKINFRNSGVDNNGLLISGSDLVSALEVSYKSGMFSKWGKLVGSVEFYEKIGAAGSNRRIRRNIPLPSDNTTAQIPQLPLEELLEAIMGLFGTSKNPDDTFSLSNLYAVSHPWTSDPDEVPLVQFRALYLPMRQDIELVTSAKTTLEHLRPFLDLRGDIKIINGILYRNSKEIKSVSYARK